MKILSIKFRSTSWLSKKINFSITVPFNNYLYSSGIFHHAKTIHFEMYSFSYAVTFFRNHYITFKIDLNHKRLSSSNSEVSILPGRFGSVIFAYRGESMQKCRQKTLHLPFLARLVHFQWFAGKFKSFDIYYATNRG